MKSLSVTLIVKNEQDNLARLLPMLSFADEIVVVDTGSTDKTVEVAQCFTDNIYYYTWCDDFSKARNFAISKATCQYIMWLDADDILSPITQKALHGWKISSENADIYYMRYSMQGEFPFWFWRERIIRRCNKCRFKGFIHESISPFGDIRYLDCEVIHMPTETHEQRNLQIYEQAIKEGKRFTLRDKFYYARTLVECNQVGLALPILRKFACNPHAYVIDRVDAYKMLANAALSVQDVNTALRYLSASVKLLPPSGEICCLFGQCYMERQLYHHAVEWYRFALYSQCKTGFVNEYYVTFLPNVQLSVCLWRLGDRQGAKRYHDAAKRLHPSHPTVLANDKWFM
ncbi:MAG: glycosyltransferase family 2 protein [Clostridiales bacterium]|nr:glycosyltransferase family 2 protein [Clostridiales bacterium]